jgi:hypothetical protein
MKIIVRQNNVMAFSFQDATAKKVLKTLQPYLIPINSDATTVYKMRDSMVLEPNGTSLYFHKEHTLISVFLP